MSEQSITFEQRMQRLQQIVQTLERGNASLEQSLALFQEGTELVRTCDKLLDEAEQQVTMITVGPDEQPGEVPFGKS